MDNLTADTNCISFRVIYQKVCMLRYFILSVYTGSVQVHYTCNHLLFEPRHEISNNVVCATSKASDQLAHTRSLIRAFASRLNMP